MSKNFNQIVIATDTFMQWLSLTNQMANAYKNVVTTATNTAGDTTTGNAFVSGTLGGNTVVVNYQMRGGTVDVSNNLTIVSNVVISGGNSTTINTNTFVNAFSFTANANTFAVTGLAGGNSITISTNSTVTNTALVSHKISITGNTTVVNTAAFSNSVTVTGSLNTSNLHNFITATNAILTSTGASTVSAPIPLDTIVDSFPGDTYRGGKYIISIRDNSNSAYQMTEIMLMHDGVTGFTTEYATLRSVANNLAEFVANLSGSTVRLFAVPKVVNSTFTVTKNLMTV